MNFQPNAGARGRGRGCGQDGGGTKAENLTACLSREAALQTGRPPLCGRQTERGMRCLLDGGPSHSPAWKRLLLTGAKGRWLHPRVGDRERTLPGRVSKDEGPGLKLGRGWPGKDLPKLSESK